MGKLSMWEKLKNYISYLELKYCNYILKKNGYDFGKYYGEELDIMYRKYKDEINFN